MKSAPQFAPYPMAQPPVYSRWWTRCAGLLALGVGGVALLVDDPSGAGPEYSQQALMAAVAAGIFVLWLLALLLRVLAYRFNQHNAQCYGETAQQIQHAWWARHRQKVALIDSVLLGPACSTPEFRQGLFSSDSKPPKPIETPEGKALRLAHVFGPDRAEREQQLAVLLALQWRKQQAEPVELRPLQCYWQGSVPAWQAFVEQMAKSWPQVELPETPEAWQGIDSLDAIIDQLQRAPSGARILCAGCQSLSIQRENPLLSGEAAVLWLFAPQGGVLFSRGEWYAADAETLPSVAERVLQQSELAAPPSKCVLFSQPDVPGLSDIGWDIRQNLQDANFGALGELEAMVAMTLAASLAQYQGKPCAWLASDPQHTLALGIVESNDSSN